MRILVVEDDKDLNRQLSDALADAGYVVDRAYDGEEGHFLGDTEPYDAVVLDIGLPQMDGISVVERWRRDGRKMPVLMLTARDRWSDKVSGIDAGADDYVTKPFHIEEILARVRALIRRAAGHASSELSCGPLRLDTKASKADVNGVPLKLTSHEFRLLAYLMHHSGEVVSRTELVEHLYDQDFDRDSNTIEVFVGRLRKKMGIDLIETVRGMGYRMREPDRVSEASDRLIGRRVRKAAAMTFLFRSLTFRVIAFSTVWAVLALIVIATVISTLYRQTSERGFDSLLSAHLFNLIGSVSATGAGQLTGSPDLGDLRFSEPESGWYWSVEPVSGGLTGQLHSISMTKPIASPSAAEVPVQPGLPAQLHCQRYRRRRDRGVRERVRSRQQQPRRALPRDGQPHRAGERDRQLPAPARDLPRRVRHRHDRHQRGRHPARPAAAAARAPGAGAGARGQCKAARRPLPDRDRAARQRDQRA